VEPTQISMHQVRVFRFVRDHGKWVSSTDIAEGAEVSPRAARHLARTLAELGIFDQIEVHPGHRYRFSDQADTVNEAYMLRLRNAEEAFGMAPIATPFKDPDIERGREPARRRKS
jgi:predicted transcriptional regulator of viral defense system